MNRTTLDVARLADRRHVERLVIIPMLVMFGWLSAVNASNRSVKPWKFSATFCGTNDCASLLSKPSHVCCALARAIRRSFPAAHLHEQYGDPFLLLLGMSPPHLAHWRAGKDCSSALRTQDGHVVLCDLWIAPQDWHTLDLAGPRKPNTLIPPPARLMRCATPPNQHQA